jgi:hypothetical protein
MALVLKNNSSRVVRGSSNRRYTRNSFFAELTAPPLVKRILETRKGITHASAVFTPTDLVWWCCRRDVDPEMIAGPGEVVTCLACAQCKGCPACRDNHITVEGLSLGKWETKDHRKLYPFEMDNEHLMNAIRKLHREHGQFKKNWQEWLVVLENEAKNRGLT